MRRLREVVDVGRAAAPLRGTIEPPPARVWERIRADIAADQDAEAGPARVPADRRPPRRRRRQLTVALAAALALVSVVVLALLLLPARPAVETTAPLEALAGGGSGSAVLLRDDAGLQLRIDGPQTAATGGYHEVWLADPALSRLVSLGPYVPGEPNRLPPGVNVTDFPIVDVSIEPLDGNPAHSGRSILRGTLP